MRKLSVILFIIVYSSNFYAQKHYTDSLWNIYRNTELEDTTRIDALYLIINFVKETDSNSDYAIKLTSFAIKEAKSKSLYRREALGYILMGYILSDKGDLKAINYSMKALEILQKMDYQLGVGRCNYSNSVIYFTARNYPKSMDYAFRAIKILDRFKDSIDLSASYNILGNIYGKAQQYSQSNKYYLLSAKYLPNKNSRDVAGVYTNIAINLDLQNKEKLAIEYNNKALSLLKVDFDLKPIATVHNNLALIYEKLKKWIVLRFII